MRISDWSSDVCSSDLAKAVKNAAEIAGHRAASVRDGAALSRFLRWVEQAAPKGGLTELDCVAKLLEFRQATGVLKDTSFDTISATGPPGAIGRTSGRVRMRQFVGLWVVAG